ncbi:MAG: hypothetical protein K0Q51_697 [Rickettsiaceae bacterium]|jgi:hypothetical protein|nr:hypothetical protein [Rickettsiaceae bacterium]
MKEKLSRRMTNKDLQEMFHEGNLIARALDISKFKAIDQDFGFDTIEVKNELRYLTSKRIDGNDYNASFG